jgi:hypothetical protein
MDRRGRVFASVSRTSDEGARGCGKGLYMRVLDRCGVFVDIKVPSTVTFSIVIADTLYVWVKNGKKHGVERCNVLMYNV